MDGIAKHLGDISTFGIFVLAVLWLVLKYVIPAVRGDRPVAPASSTSEADAAADHHRLEAERSAAVLDMMRDIHRWQQKEPVDAATKTICDEVRETRETLCRGHNEMSKDVRDLREKVIEYAATTRKYTPTSS